MLKNKLVLKLILFLIICLSLFFNLYHKNVSPPGFNADEATFSYNAYSISQTGKDEYGVFLPVRLKSFGDYKLPFFTYFSLPFIKLFGLSQTTARLPNTFLAILFPLLIFFLVQELFSKKSISLLASFFTAVSLGLNIVGRHTHEAYLASFLISLGLLLLLRILKKPNLTNQVFFFLTMIAALFTYHSNRILVGILFLIAGYFVFINKKLKINFLIIFGVIIIGFLATDIFYAPARVNNLFFFKDPGFVLKINELKGEGQGWFFNKLTVGLKDTINDYLTYFSPQFLAINGDSNYRFGSPGMGMMNIIEYLSVFLGIYFLFKNKEKYCWLLLAILFASPITACLAWQKSSLTRSFFILIPLLIIAAYGLIYFFQNLKKQKYFLPLLGLTFIAYSFFFIYNWSFYLFHYPKKALVINAWQPGYFELTDYVKKNYDRFDNFYVTKDNGMPYIFFLFYLKYPPEKYQQQANLTGPDQYGFGQVEKFDKFIFHFESPKQVKKSVIVGSSADFKNLDSQSFNAQKIKKIKKYDQDIFWIYEVD